MSAFKRKDGISAWLMRLLDRVLGKVSESAKGRTGHQRIPAGRLCLCGEWVSDGWACKCKAHLVKPHRELGVGMFNAGPDREESAE